MIQQLSQVILKRNLNQFKQFSNLLHMGRCSSVFKHDYSQQQYQQRHQRTLRNILTCSVFIYGIGYTFYKWKDKSIKELLDVSLNHILPVVHAKSINTVDISGYRNKYNFIADVVDICVPSVVCIEIKDERRRRTVRNGSGFIVEADGLILTNAHVVIKNPYATFQVRLYDGSTHVAQVEDVDMRSDLATLRIKKNNLPVMKLGDSSTIRPGEFVVAIGSPLYLNNTITCGVVSSANRQSQELGIHDKHMQYIQTDTTITFGSSGGPLVNLSGEAIGISTMTIVSGISFAIPIDYAKDFLKLSESRRKNQVTKSEIHKTRYIGITMLTLSPAILSELQQKSEKVPYDLTHGVMVWEIVPGSPAEKSGLQPEDIITHVNNQPITSSANIYQVLEQPGPIDMTVLRRGKVFKVRVTPEQIS